MSTAPILTLRSSVSPYPALSSIPYIQSKTGGPALPVLAGENSDISVFRIYNNFLVSAGIATANNLYLTCYDGQTSVSHTANMLPVSQSWVHVYENMFGESTPSVSYSFTRYLGADTAIGGTPAGASKYYPENGSDGTSGNSRIRAGTNQNGYGFIEVNTYVKVPTTATTNTYSFAISVVYDWVS